MRSGLRHCQSFAVIDAHAAGEIQSVAIRRIGADLIFARLGKEGGIPEVLRSVLKARQYGFDIERAVYLTVLHRLFANGSDRAAERWRGHAKDHRPDLKQMIVGIAADVEGRHLAGQYRGRHHPFAGCQTHAGAFPDSEITIVADRGMVSQTTLEA